MSVLIEQYRPESFGKVPLLEDALDEFDEKSAKTFLKSLGQIFVKHKAYDTFGICIVHRHFDIPAHHVLVHTKRSDGELGISIPWNIKDGNVVKPADTHLLDFYKINDYSTYKYVVADNWYFDDSKFLTDGTIETIPFEFRTSNTPTKTQPNDEFALELYHVLRQAGVQNLIGIRSLANIKDTSTWEQTPAGLPANVTVYGEKPFLEHDDMIDVGWRFDSLGNIRRETDGCNRHTIQCNRHQY